MATRPADTYQSSSFIPIIAAAPLWGWGVIFLGAGLACGAAAAFRHDGLARLGMAWWATATLLVGVGLLLAVFTNHLATPSGPIVWLCLAFRDFVVCAQPIRSPCEGLTQQRQARARRNET